MPQHRRSARRLARHLTVGSGPLRRRSDRVESAARVLLLAAVLAAVVTGIVIGRVTYAQGSARAAAEAAGRHEVTARLVADAPPPVATAWDGPDLRHADAVWQDSIGVDHPVSVVVPAGMRTGYTVAAWIDRTGQVVPRPLQQGDVAGLAVAQGAGIAVGLWAVAFGAWVGCRELLDRSRSRRWAAEWAVVEPVWRGRVC